jgi:hypothetical protein
MTDETTQLDADPHESDRSFSRPPFPHSSGKVLILRHRPHGSGDDENLVLWDVPSDVVHRFRGAAAARGRTEAKHLTALIDLHEAMRQRADGGDDEMAALLDQLGLRTVSI